MVTTQFAEVGGVENVVRSLTGELSDQHNVSLITRKREQNVEEFSENFEQVYEIEGTEKYKEYLIEGRKFFKEHSDEFDIFHFHNWSPILPTLGVNINSILTIHGTSFGMTLENQGFLHALPYWPLEQLAVNIPDLTTSITQYHLGHFVKLKQTKIIRNGVNTDKFKPAESERKEELRNKYNVKGHGILIVGRHVRQKGHKELIEAVKEFNDYTLMIPSDGELREQLEKEAEQKNLNTEFYGKVSEKELIELYQAADIFCLPSWGEGLPLTILEALSSGLPVITTDVGDNKTIIKDSEAGKTVKPQNPNQLKQQIKTILGQDLEKKSSKARKYAEKHLDWQKITNKYIKTYEKVIE